MGNKVNYYLLGGFKIEDFIREPVSVWTRPNLVSPPSLLQYNYKCVDGLHIYTNSMGCCICLYEYGSFTPEEMLKDYNDDSNSSVYLQKYTKIVEIISRIYKKKIIDIDWVMTLSCGKFHVGDSHVSISMPLMEENCEFVACIDASIIYQSVQCIGRFFKNLSAKDKLTRFEQYKVSYYTQEMNILSSPNVFLTNALEKEITQEFYDKWHISEEISIIQSIANQAVNIFSFVSNYRKNNEANYSTLFMSYLSLLLLYEGIGNLLTFIIPINSVYLDAFLKFLIGAITLVYIVRILKYVIRDIRDKYDLKKNTKKK